MGQVIRLLVITLSLTLAACGGGNNPGAGAPAMGAQVKIKITPESALLTGVGESRQLSAQAVDAFGNPLPGTVTWTSSDPAIVSVDNTGTVRAAVTAGTVRITATVGAVQSAPAYVYVAKPVVGAQLVTDDHIVSGPRFVEPPAEPNPDHLYEVVLRDAPSLAPGTILINTEAIPVAGRVVSTTPVGSDLRVRLVVVPPNQLFTDFEFKDTVDLTQLPFEIPDELTATYDIKQTGNTSVFTPKPTASAHRFLAARAAVGTTALPPLPPFRECEASAEFGSDRPMPLVLSALPSFEVSVNGTLKRELTPLGETVLVRSTPTFKASIGLEIKSGFEGKVQCKLTLRQTKVVLRYPQHSPREEYESRARKSVQFQLNKGGQNV